MARGKNPFSDPTLSPELPYGTVEPGLVLGGRYRLEERLTSQDDVSLWEAYDETLSRLVLLYAIPPGHRLGEPLLAAARAAATATDARFLRVLDALEYDTLEPVSFIVTEYVPGCRLDEVLRSGPLSGLASAWLVQQVAAALAPLHAQDLFHERLSPACVIITRTGNARIAGFLLDAALTPRLGGDGFPLDPSRGERQRADLRSLGQVFYACLTGTWPLLDTYEPAGLYGLAPAPRGDDGLLVAPRELRPGLAAALDTVCLQTLEPRAGSAAVRRAADLASILGRVLGSADARDELAARVRRLAPASLDTDPSDDTLSAGTTLTVRHLPGATAATVVVPRRTAEPEPAPDAAAPDGNDSAVSGHGDGAAPGAAPEAVDPADPAGAVPAADGSPDAPAAPSSAPQPPTAGVRAASARDALVGLLPGRPHLASDADRRLPGWAWPAMAACVVLLVVLAVVKGCSGGGDDDGGGSAVPVAVTIAAGYDFDPVADGGSGDESRDQVPLAYDGDPATAWTSETYFNNAKLGGLKPGIGLVLDLGRARTVTRVDLALGAVPVTVELRVPADDPSGDSLPGFDSQSQWTAVSGPVDTPATATSLSLDQPVTTRWVMVYFSSLAPVADKRYQAVVDEVTVFAQP